MTDLPDEPASVRSLRANGDHVSTVLADYIDALRQRAEAWKEWREAVIDALVVCHLYSKAHDTDPRRAIADVISWHCQVALDPQVSSDAAALIKRGAEAEQVLIRHYSDHDFTPSFEQAKELLIKERNEKKAGEIHAARLEAELAARTDELGRYMMANNRLAQEREAMRKALMELVELKDLHDKIEASEFTVTKARQQQEYEKRKPLAWKAARAAIDREKA